MSFDIDKATRDSVPTFKFGAIDHGFRGEIVAIDDEVEQEGDKRDDDGRKLKEKYIVIQVEIKSAKGGDREIPDDKDSPIIDTPAGEVRSLWLRYELGGKPSYSPLTRALSAAVKESGAKAFEVGAEITCKHNELGKKPDNPTHNRAKLFKASYKAPVKASSVALDDF